MELPLSPTVAGRQTEYPAAVLTGILVRAPDGRTHSRRWEGVIDTGADLLVLPVEIADELRLAETRQRVRVWTYRKDDRPTDGALRRRLSPTRDRIAPDESRFRTCPAPRSGAMFFATLSRKN